MIAKIPYIVRRAALLATGVIMGLAALNYFGNFEWVGEYGRLVLALATMMVFLTYFVLFPRGMDRRND